MEAGHMAAVRRQAKGETPSADSSCSLPPLAAGCCGFSFKHSRLLKSIMSSKSFAILARFEKKKKMKIKDLRTSRPLDKQAGVELSKRRWLAIKKVLDHL